MCSKWEYTVPILFKLLFIPITVEFFLFRLESRENVAMGVPDKKHIIAHIFCACYCSTSVLSLSLSLEHDAYLNYSLLFVFPYFHAPLNLNLARIFQTLVFLEEFGLDKCMEVARCQIFTHSFMLPSYC